MFLFVLEYSKKLSFFFGLNFYTKIGKMVRIVNIVDTLVRVCLHS